MLTGNAGVTLLDAAVLWYTRHGLAMIEGGSRGSSPVVLNPVFSEALMGLPADWTRSDNE
jgi:hypothetical protein